MKLSFEYDRPTPDKSTTHAHYVVRGGTQVTDWEGPAIELLAPDLRSSRAERITPESAFNRVAMLGADAVERLEAVIRRAFPSVSRILTLPAEDSRSNFPPYVALVGKAGTQPIHVAGDGMNRLFVTACFAATLPNGVLLMEEPECFLHPAGMTLLAAILTDALQNGTQVILSTHSIELIDKVLATAREQSRINDVAVQMLKLEDGKLSVFTSAGGSAVQARETIDLELR